nr:retrovirus-related Pol polyprotein from transposon TNT 1-94 [Tanacetum cinerariifolium]
MLIFSRALLFLWAEAIATACYTQNRSIVHRQFGKTPYKLINDRKPDISFLHVFRALCYPKNDHEDIEKLGAKGDIGLFISYSTNSCTYRVYNRRTKKIMETMNVTFDELSAMVFEQSNLKPELQNLLFEAMYYDSIGGQPSTAPRTISTAQAPQTLTASITIENTSPTPTNSLSQATNIPNTSQDVDALETQQQHAQQQENQSSLQPKTVVDNVPNAMFDENTFANPFATPSISDAESSSSQYVDPSNMHTFYEPYPPEFQWTKDHPLEQDSVFELTRFSNGDYAGSKDTFKSTSSGAQFLGEKLVSCSSKKQDCAALSITEAEYVSLSAKFRVILFSIHSDEWKSFQSHHQTALRIRRWRYNLILAESRFKTSCSINKDTFKMKARVHVSKSSANL